jgi:hypothetical protein
MVVGAELGIILLLIGRLAIKNHVRSKFLAGKLFVTLPEDLVGVEV